MAVRSYDVEQQPALARPGAIEGAGQAQQMPTVRESLLLPNRQVTSGLARAEGSCPDAREKSFYLDALMMPVGVARYSERDGKRTCHSIAALCSIGDDRSTRLFRAYAVC